MHFSGVRASLFLYHGGDMSCLWRLRMYTENTIFHALLIKIISFHFPPKEKISYFLEKRNTIFPDITKKIMFRSEFFGKTIFSEHLKKISYFQVKEDLKKKIIFSGKINARIIIISLQSLAYQEYSVYCIV